MKAVLRSAKPYWIYLILTGKKTIEVGKDFPKAEDWDKVVEMYCSKDMRYFNRIPEKDRGWMRKYFGKVACRFVCDRIELLKYNSDGYSDEWHEWNDNRVDYKDMCLSERELEEYLGVNNGYGWHISDLKIYDTPKELGEFRHVCKHDHECDDCRHWEYQYVEKGGVDLICPVDVPLTRPPQSWCYVEEID